MKEKLLKICEKIELKLDSLVNLKGININRIDDVRDRKIYFYIKVNEHKESCFFSYKEICDEKIDLNQIVLNYIFDYFKKYNYEKSNICDLFVEESY